VGDIDDSRLKKYSSKGRDEDQKKIFRGYIRDIVGQARAIATLTQDRRADPISRDNDSVSRALLQSTLRRFKERCVACE